MNRRRTLTIATALLIALLTSPAMAHGVSPAGPRVEVVFVLDTTGSMAGLIDGAKSKIWDVANMLISAEPTPDIRFGLVGYRDRGDTYVTEVHDLSDNIDAVYGQLNGFQADGGGDSPESVNQALAEALNRMSWTDGDDTLRIIFLVGDAPPHMDYAQDSPYTVVVPLARERGIVVNAIQCGSDAETTRVWRDIAEMGGGEYSAIEQNGGVAVISTPFDEELARLNREMAATVVAWGSHERQREIGGYADTAAAADAPAAADRLSYSLAAGEVVGGGGDLVDALAQGDVSLGGIEEEQLPAHMRDMTPSEREAFMAQKTAERSRIQEQISALLGQRQAFIDTEMERRRSAGELTGFDAEVDRMLREQGTGVGLHW